MRKEDANFKISRRSFLKGTMAAGLFAVAGCGQPAETTTSSTEGTSGAETTAPQSQPTPEVITPPEEQIYMSTCRTNCAHACAWDVHVRDGCVVNLTPHEYEDDPENINRGGCARGYLNIQRMYHKDRIKYPMKRVGERGAGQWERITWDEAIDMIATKWKGYIDEYGPSSIALWTGAGNQGVLHGFMPYGAWNRFKMIMGLSTISKGIDYAQMYTMPCVKGTETISKKSLEETECFIAWGLNPIESRTAAWKHIAKAQRKGAKIVTIDPIFSATASKSDIFVPLKPATDAALAMGMARILITENKCDIPFVKKNSVAPYLVKKSDGKYLRTSDLGMEIPEGGTDEIIVWSESAATWKKLSEITDTDDMVITGIREVEGHAVDTAFDLLKAAVEPYTESYTEEITHVPAATIRELAELMATRKTYIGISNGMGHYLNSPTAFIAILTLCILTGNHTKPGTGNGFTFDFVAMPSFNLMYAYGFPGGGKTISDGYLLETMNTNMYGGEEVHLKSVLIHSANVIGGGGGQADRIAALNKMDFVVVPEIMMNDTAKYADLVLPIAHWFEVDDCDSMGYFPYHKIIEKAVEPPYECKSDYEIIQLISEKLGCGEYFKQSAVDALKELIDTDANAAKGISYDILKEKKAVRIYADDAISHPNGAPYTTATGKLQFYLETPAPRLQRGQTQEELDQYRLPAYYHIGEVLDEGARREQYPLVLLTPHTKYGAQTTFHFAPWWREIMVEPMCHINPEDAAARGIADGDKMRMFNERGECVLKAKYNAGVPQGILLHYHGWSSDAYEKGHYQLSSSKTDAFSDNVCIFDVTVQAEKA